MRNDYTHISFVLDASGSMAKTRSDTIGGFNSFLDKQRSAPGYATMTLRQFADHAERCEYEFRAISEVPDLTELTYIPDGSTALYDAIGYTITDTGAFLRNLPEAARPSKVIIAILTDGKENASRRYSAGVLADMIKLQTDVYKWEFAFLGANQNAILTAGLLNIEPAKVMTYAANAAGTASAYCGLAEKVSLFRSTGIFAFDEHDRMMQTVAGVDPSHNSTATPST